MCGVHGLSAMEVAVLEHKTEALLALNNMVARIAQGNLGGTVVYHVRLSGKLHRMQCKMMLFMVYYVYVRHANCK